MLIQDVEKQIALLNLPNSDTDKALIALICDQVAERICNFCHLPAIPHQLKNTAVMNVIGEYLKYKKLTNTLKIEGMEIDAIVDNVKLGDMSVKLVSGTGMTDAEKVDELINTLTNYGKGDLVCFRKIKW